MPRNTRTGCPLGTGPDVYHDDGPGGHPHRVRHRKQFLLSHRHVLFGFPLPVHHPEGGTAGRNRRDPVRAAAEPDPVQRAHFHFQYPGETRQPVRPGQHGPGAFRQRGTDLHPCTEHKLLGHAGLEELFHLRFQPAGEPGPAGGPGDGQVRVRFRLLLGRGARRGCQRGPRGEQLLAHIQPAGHHRDRHDTDLSADRRADRPQPPHASRGDHGRPAAGSLGAHRCGLEGDGPLLHHPARCDTGLRRGLRPEGAAQPDRPGHGAGQHPFHGGQLGRGDCSRPKPEPGRGSPTACSVVCATTGSP
jgi:hypothetical protein